MDFKKLKWNLSAILITVLIYIPTNMAFGYSRSTHVRIMKRVVENIKINKDSAARLEFKRQYGIDLTQKFDASAISWERTINEWFEFGAEAEDGGTIEGVAGATIGTARFYNHFYNPVHDSLVDFPDATQAMRDQGGGGGMYDNKVPIPLIHGRGDASIAWAQDLEGNDYSWKKAREYFFSALTETTKDDREENIAKMFRSLGQVVHLLQDAGQPAHVRNDAHPADSISGIPGPNLFLEERIETWAKEHVRNRDIHAYLNQIAGPINYTQLVPSGKPTIKDFFDTLRGNGASFDPVNSKGLAEFSNHNFFSEDTIPGGFGKAKTSREYHNFKYPQIDKTTVGLVNKKRVFQITQYDDPLPVASPPTQFGKPPVIGKRMSKPLEKYGSGDFSIRTGDEDNEIVFKDNVDRLIPKILAYSISAVDFFFRGKFDIIITFQPVGAIDGGEFHLDITNQSGEPIGPGEYAIYLEDSMDRRCKVPGYENIPIAQGEEFKHIIFNLPSSFPIPQEGCIDMKNGFMLVYKGRLGNEYDNLVTLATEPEVVIGQRFNLLRVNIEWPDQGQPALGSDQDLYMRAPDGSIIAFYQPITEFGQLDFDDIGGNGPENITIKHLSVPGDYQFMVNYYRDWWKESQYDSNSMQCVPLTCPPEDPAATGQNTPDDEPPGPPSCYCTTRVHNKVRTYFNSIMPVRTQFPPTDDIYVRDPSYAAGLPTNNNEGQVDDSWWVIQTVCVDDAGKIFITNPNGNPQQPEVHYNSANGKCE